MQQGAPIRQAPPVAQGRQEEPDPATLREMLLSNQHEMSLLSERNPPLAEALKSGSLGEYCTNKDL